MTQTVRQWDIVKVRIHMEDRDEHPAVVLSREEYCGDARQHRLNVLYGTTRRPTEAVGPLEVFLDEADGLNQGTLFSCGHFFTVSKEKISRITGRVSVERRRQIGRRIVEAYRLPL